MAKPFYSQRQKGPRAYIVFSMGRAVAITDMAKDADHIIRNMKAKQMDATKWRRSSRPEAEEFSAWMEHTTSTMRRREREYQDAAYQRAISTKGG